MHFERGEVLQGERRRDEVFAKSAATRRDETLLSRYFEAPSGLFRRALVPSSLLDCSSMLLIRYRRNRDLSIYATDSEATGARATAR